MNFWVFVKTLTSIQSTAVMELADMLGLEPSAYGVRVQIPSAVLCKT